MVICKRKKSKIGYLQNITINFKRVSYIRVWYWTISVKIIFGDRKLHCLSLAFSLPRSKFLPVLAKVVEIGDFTDQVQVVEGRYAGRGKGNFTDGGLACLQRPLTWRNGHHLERNKQREISHICPLLTIGGDIKIPRSRVAKTCWETLVACL